MKYRMLVLLIGIGLGSAATAQAYGSTSPQAPERAERRAGLQDTQGKPVAQVDQDGRTAIIVQYPTGTPFSRSAGTGGFADAPRVTREVFQSLDDDGSGALEPGEVPLTITLGQRFADYDINGDGLIAKNEFQSYRAAERWLQGEENLSSLEDPDTGLDVDVVEVDPAEQ